MLHHPTLDKLQQLRLNGMPAALREQLDLPEVRLELRGAPRAAGRSRANRARETPPADPPASGQAQAQRLPGRPRPPHPARARSGADHSAGHRRMDPRRAQMPDPRPHRRRENMDRLRTRPAGLPPGLHHPLSAPPRLFEELRLAHADGRFPKLMRSPRPICYCSTTGD